MAVRTTEAAVEGIIEVDTNISLTPFIEVANVLVTQCCTDLTTEYSASILELIERWLSAHFYTVRDMRAMSEKAGLVSEKKQSKVDLGFSTSHYGQHAMMIDYQGGLASLNQQILAGKMKTTNLTWLGTENPVQVSDPN